MKKLVYLLCILFTSLSIAQEEDVFKEGNRFYNEGQFNEAIVNYETILKSGKHSADLYFNLANAHYKLNHIAPSIFYYEKALMLSPNDSDIKNNLSFARNMTIDAIDHIPEVGISNQIDMLAKKLSFDDWAKITVILTVLFVILVISFYFTKSTAKKRLSFVAASLALISCGIVLALTYRTYDLEQNDHPAIIFAKESIVKSEPNLRGEASFVLHEGTKVQILDSFEDWKKIRLTDGKTGWISDQDLKALKNQL